MYVGSSHVVVASKKLPHGIWTGVFYLDVNALDFLSSLVSVDEAWI